MNSEQCNPLLTKAFSFQKGKLFSGVTKLEKENHMGAGPELVNFPAP